MYTLLTLLIIHLISLIVMAGTTFVEYVIIQRYWKFSDTAQHEKANGLLEASGSFSRITGIGAALLIVSGLLMMVVTHGVFGEQLWFRIKFVLVIILVANALFVGRKQGIHLRKKALDVRESKAVFIPGIRKKSGRFYGLQFLLFVIIIVLSIFKFN